MTAASAPTPGPWLTPFCPQCRPRANCDGCAYLLTVTHSLFAGGRSKCRLRANCEGRAHPRPAHPHTHAVSAPRRQYTHARGARPAVNGQAARVGCWTGRGRRHAAEFSKPPTRYRLRRMSRTVIVSDPRLQNLLVNISCKANSAVCRAFLVSFPGLASRTPAPPSVRRRQLSNCLFFSLILFLSPAGPDAGRSQHGTQARPAGGT